MAEKKTSNAKRPAPSRDAASHEEAPRKNSRAQAEKKAQAKRRSIIEDIIVIVVVALSVLCYVAMFSSAIPWLKTALFWLFGNLMYVTPLLFVILAVVLRMGDRTGLFIRRVISVVLILFAVSGLFSFFSGEPKNGGLLGRLNYVMMNKLLGTAGATVINIFLIVVAVVLFVDFSVFAYLKEKQDPEREENQRKRVLQEEKREAKRKTRQLESERRVREEIDEIQEKNRRLEAEERLNRRFVGIGDTTITSDEEAPTTFMADDHDAASKNSSIFNKYKNNGKENVPGRKEEEDDVPFDLSDEIFMPPIHLGDEYLPEDGDGLITSETPEETPEERTEKA
ncbi:MAG: DNA translocase FtsK 4TM domain-containing protein, partial [Lachnospiraceae bacterium]|nr:DNA translocase FtsK 4TM domain-containing protein [Lachnospiraceae bacterium]